MSPARRAANRSMPSMLFLHIVGGGAAALLLRFKGHRILSRRFNTPVGSISFVTLHDNRLAFIETTPNLPTIIPSRHKRRIIRAAQYWLEAHPDFSGHEIGFDAVFGVAPPRYVADIIMLPRPRG